MSGFLQSNPFENLGSNFQLPSLQPPVSTQSNFQLNLGGLLNPSHFGLAM